MRSNYNRSPSQTQSILPILIQRAEKAFKNYIPFTQAQTKLSTHFMFHHDEDYTLSINYQYLCSQFPHCDLSRALIIYACITGHFSSLRTYVSSQMGFVTNDSAAKMLFTLISKLLHQNTSAEWHYIFKHKSEGLFNLIHNTCLYAEGQMPDAYVDGIRREITNLRATAHTNDDRSSTCQLL